MSALPSLTSTLLYIFFVPSFLPPSSVAPEINVDRLLGNFCAVFVLPRRLHQGRKSSAYSCLPDSSTLWLVFSILAADVSRESLAASRRYSR